MLGGFYEAKEFDPMEKLLDKLSQIINPERVITDPARLDEVSWDALSRSRIHPLRKPTLAEPLCVALPVSTDEVRRIVMVANQERIPIVPFGGGSGLMGGALSLQRNIVLDLRRMDRILEIDQAGLAARVQSGVVLEILDTRLNEHALMLGHDPWTLPVATVGGAISTNSLGYRGGKYGSIGDQTLGLEAVLPTGEILRTRALPKVSTGLNLKYLFVGGEGCFGIVTEATLRVFSLPEQRALHAFRFASFEQGFSVVQKVFARGVRPALLDFGDSPAKLGNDAVLYIGVEGPPETVAAEEKVIVALCDAAEAIRMPSEQAERFWLERHVIANRFMRNRRLRREFSSDPIRRDWVHVALPASKVLAYRKEATQILSRRGVQLRESGVWTQPELFSMSLMIEDPDVEKSQRTLQDTVDEVVGLAQQMGGSMEYCHGVGVKLAPFMAREHGHGLEVMRQIKRTLDPKNIMNPGKLALQRAE